MAKRKRLIPANPAFLESGARGAVAGETPALKRVPIAEISAETSALAAMQEVTQELLEARESGRMVTLLRLDQIDLSYLVRDRVVSDEDDMASLMASIRDSGQRSPVDVVQIEPGRYGLISGWRRCEAIRRLQAEAHGNGEVRALLRRPENALDAYLSMVEENEIRVGLSYYERARIVAKVVEQQVFPDAKAALLTLFRAASRAKRSKIRSFLQLVSALDAALKFPQAIGERLGLQLAKQLEEAPEFGPALQARLHQAAPVTAEAELALLTAALVPARQPDLAAAPAPQKPPAFTQKDLRPGLQARIYPASGKVELSGKAMTEDLRRRLLLWLESQG